MTHSPPRLILVTGPPGSGKTTLAHALAGRVYCPAICRDELREGMMNTLEGAEAEAGDVPLQVFETFFETLALLAGRKISLIAEAAFRHTLWENGLRRIDADVDMRVVQCRLPLPLLEERYVRRRDEDDARRLHPDGAFLAELRQGISLADWDMDGLGAPVLTVDTSNGYRPALDEIAEFVRR